MPSLRASRFPLPRPCWRFARHCSSEHEGLLLQTHLNENLEEIAEVARLFPWAADYLAVYERFGLSRSRRGYGA